MKKEDLKVGMTIINETASAYKRKILFVGEELYVYLNKGGECFDNFRDIEEWEPEPDPVPETQTIKLFRYTYKKFIKFTPDFLYDQSFWTTRSYEIFSDMQGTQNAVLVKTEEKEIEVPE